MRTILLITFLASFPSFADIYATFETGKPKQIWTGTQPNDRPTRFARMNIGIHSRSDTNGLVAAAGYDFLCAGDQNPNKKQITDSTTTKKLAVTFDTDSPLYYDTWNAAVLENRSCYITWSASAVGTTDSSGANVGFELNGAFGSVILNFTNSSTSPTLKKAKAESNIFNMYKEPACDW